MQCKKEKTKMNKLSLLQSLETEKQDDTIILEKFPFVSGVPKTKCDIHLENKMFKKFSY